MTVGRPAGSVGRRSRRRRTRSGDRGAQPSHGGASRCRAARFVITPIAPRAWLAAAPGTASCRKLKRLIIEIRTTRSETGVLPETGGWESIAEWTESGRRRRGESIERSGALEVTGAKHPASDSISEPVEADVSPRAANGTTLRPAAATSRSFIAWAHRRFVCPINRNRPQDPRMRGGGVCTSTTAMAVGDRR